MRDSRRTQCDVRCAFDLVRKEGKASFIGFANDLPGIPVVPMMLKTLTVFGMTSGQTRKR